MSLKHFSHEHPLGLSTPRSRGSCCNMCGMSDYGKIYTCDKCPNFYIDKWCAKLQQEINHPFHPQHPLTFLAKSPYDDFEEFQCCACGGMSNGSTYHCSLCKFDLHISCATLMITECLNHHIGDGEPHPIFVCNLERETDFVCSGCYEPIENSKIYVCIQCKILIDQSCAELPKEIRNHPFHPDHTLTLIPRPPPSGNSEYICCSACSKRRYSLIFHCFECDQFSLDFQCSFLKPIKTTLNNVGHSHSHPLFLCKSTTKSSFVCNCGEAIIEDDDDSILCCLECHCLLHKSCAEFPVEIEHVFHRLHPLKLRLWSWKDCIACLQPDRRSEYVCDNGCEFAIDVSCALSTPQILRSPLHRHPLAFFSLVAKKLCCTLCNLSSKNNFFRCLECDFNVHFLCIPRLPRVLSDGNHIHLLTLTETPVKDYEDEDDDAEFLCDRCEKERILCDPTYICEECHYVAHIQCVISEVIRLMEEECSLGQKLDDKNEVVSKALTTEVEGITKSEKLRANKHSILYSVAEKHEGIIALRAEVAEEESKLETSMDELKAFEEKFPQFTNLFLKYSDLTDLDSD